MSEDDNHSPPAPQAPPPAAAARRSGGIKVVSAVLLLIVIAASLAAIFWMRTYGFTMPLAVASGDASQKIAALELKVETLDARVTDLSARVDDVAAAPASTPSSEPSKTPKTAAADLAHMQGDLAALAATVSGLRADAASARAESVAFVQLRGAALSGHGFARELEVLQDVAKNDSGLKDAAAKLAPFAEKGAPPISQLRESLTGQIASADAAVAKAKAQNWWERVLAELKGLVSVRVLHGGASANAALDAMQAALARGDLGAALEDIKNLPPEAQQTLDAWRQEAEARQSVDENLRALADRLIAGANAAPSAQDAP